MSSRQRRGPHRRAFLALSAAAAARPASAADEPSKPPALSPLAEAQVQAIVAKHGAKMTAEQKADLKRLIAGIHKTSETLNAYPLPENSEPRMAFRVYRADRR
jgi:hypothetical protein